MPRGGTCLAALAAAAIAAAAAPAMAAPSANGRHAVEFHARPGGVFGHTYVTYGRLDGDGRLREARYAGFYPTGALSQTVLLAVLATPGKVGAEPADRTLRSEMVYRRELTARDYAHLDREVKILRMSRPFWQLVFYNCNSFAAEVATSMGLRVPSTLELPKDFVRGLFVLNRRGGPRLGYAEAGGPASRLFGRPDVLYWRPAGPRAGGR
jgi:hypothetical protein